MAQVSDDAHKITAQEAKTLTSTDFRVHDEKSEAAQRASRLREAVRSAGGNKAISARSGIPGSTLSDYLAGKEWKFSSVAALASACQVSLDWLATGQLPEMRRVPSNAPGTDVVMTDSLGNRIQLQSKTYAILPRYDVEASAGYGSIVEDEQVAGYLALEDAFVRQVLHRRQQDLVTIGASGDSMEPTVHDGDILIVDTSAKTIQNGCIYVINVNGVLLVKRLSIRLDGQVVVRSDNPKYEVETTSSDDLRIIGQVVYQAGPVRS